MSERLIKLVNDALITKGMDAIRDGSGLAEQTILKVAQGIRIPRRRNAFKLALACGSSEAEALALARECLPLRAKRAG